MKNINQYLITEAKGKEIVSFDCSKQMKELLNNLLLKYIDGQIEYLPTKLRVQDNKKLEQEAYYISDILSDKNNM